MVTSLSQFAFHVYYLHTEFANGSLSRNFLSACCHYNYINVCVQYHSSTVLVTFCKGIWQSCDEQVFDYTKY